MHELPENWDSVFDQSACDYLYQNPFYSNDEEGDIETFSWYGRAENTDPSMLHIFIEVAMIDHNSGESNHVDVTFEIYMAIRGKNSKSQ